MTFRYLLWFLSSAWAVSCLEVWGSVRWNDACPGAAQLGPAKVVLDHGSYSGGIRKDGNFIIHGVPDGTYILSVVSHDHAFDQLRVDVVESTNVTVRPYVPGTPLNPPASVILPFPVVLSAKQKYDYFTPVQSFNLIAMFSNPMMLMVAVGGAGLGMMYLMKKMDPETMEEFKQHQAKLAGLQNAMANGDFKSGISALMDAGDEPKASTSTAKAPAQAAKNRNNARSKRR
ncbi:hypothetical protein BDN72DRAFT_873417 [Pluteus cervinus]|uniref:Uncharacterized protein n=1 Tax=Pluteus cervinus TaxID=181527 RepID=A0ACD3BFE6_9AGAR|nr:hypothetical protein BDN72DRAFT_873417 [Pluteus cervinus]